jgi:hypothetical protein
LASNITVTLEIVEMASLNWGRGFFRLWLALSVVWIVVLGYACREDLTLLLEPSVWRTSHRAPVSESKSTEKPIGRDEGLMAQLQDKDERSREMQIADAFDSLRTVSLPPLLTLLAGCLIVWVGRGFFHKPWPNP